MSEELICELSHNDVIIDAVLMPPAQEMHSPDQSGKPSAKINDEVDTMAVEQVKQQKNNKLPVIKMTKFQKLFKKVKNCWSAIQCENRISVIKLSIANVIDKMASKVGVNLSEIKPSKFKNRFELFKSMLQLFKYTNEKNHLMEKEMVVKIFGFAKSILESTNKTKRHKRELGEIQIRLGAICKRRLPYSVETTFWQSTPT
uniref:Uncharacterized protein n=1 Tax=Globodera rostochiensis TaxID=31243 RepID=A0A914HTT8_GLORO